MSDFVPVPSYNGQPPPPPSMQWNNGRGRGYNFGRHGGGGRGYGRHGGRGRGRRQERGRGRYQRQQGQRQQQIYDNVLEELGVKSDTSLSIAVEGCCHGELDNIYGSLMAHQERTGQKIDLLLCCGDFQSLRNTHDYHSLAVPPKYRSLGSFCKYYSGEKVAPILTIFVGGNHEASQPLHELYYGGWVAENIYYLGAVGVVRFGGIRIGGISGIYKSNDYNLGRFERPPYDRSSLRSVYHVRSIDVYRMKCLSADSNNTTSTSQDGHESNANSKDRFDIMISHDWPQGIEQHGNTDDLVRRKPYFRDEIQRNDLGSPPNNELLHTLKPKWWFSAHLHVKFLATVHHKDNDSTDKDKVSKVQDYAGLIPSQLQLEQQQQQPVTGQEAKTSNSNMSMPERSSCGEPPSKDNSTVVMSTTQFHSLESSTGICNSGLLTLENQMTQFLALDKCLPRRHYLCIIHVPRKGNDDKDDDGDDALFLENKRQHASNETETDRLKTKISSEAKNELRLEYDLEWLAVLKKTHHLTTTERRNVHMHIPSEFLSVTDADINWVKERFIQKAKKSKLSSSEDVDGVQIEEASVTNTVNRRERDSLFAIPHNFQRTVPVYNDPDLPSSNAPPLGMMGNPQTDELLHLLDLDHKITIPYNNNNNNNSNGNVSATFCRDFSQARTAAAPTKNNVHTHDDNEIDIDDEEDGSNILSKENDSSEISNDNTTTKKKQELNVDDTDDKDEIQLDDDDDEEEKLQQEKEEKEEADNNDTVSTIKKPRLCT